MDAPRPPRPLEGLRVLELGQLMAAPLAGAYLAYFGAEVVKVEPPGAGDPIRGWRVLLDGTSLWWRSLGRNKRLVTLDLRRPEGQEVARRLAGKADVLLENFRPGTLEGWGLGPERLRAENPGLVVARVSGFGQTGPDADRPGFAAVCEAVGGLRHVTGHPGEVPVRSNLSLGDSLAAFQAVIGVLLALLRRGASGTGQVVDVSIVEAVLAVMEAAVPEYDACGAVRGPSGTTITGVVPTDAYPCRDGRHVVIGGNGDSIFRRLMREAGRPDLADDPALASNAGRAERRGEIDAAISAWTGTLDAAEVASRLRRAAVPCGPIQDVAEILADPHLSSRGCFEQVAVPDGGGTRPVRLPALGPRLSESPGRTEHAGGERSADTAAVLADWLGMAPSEIERLRRAGVLEAAGDPDMTRRR
jgi:crotonobetainyl-CoA:carnitine CoA-transferase CaiB-like acyl-CoA transferase